MNTWSLDLADSIGATPETNLQLQTYIILRVKVNSDSDCVQKLDYLLDFHCQPSCSEIVLSQG